MNYQVQIIDLFKTQILARKFDDDNMLEEACQILLDIENKDKQQIPCDYVEGSYTNYSPSAEILNLPQLSSIKRFIDESVLDFHHSHKLQTHINLTNSWFSINRKKGYHPRHTHLPSIWSGVFYLQASNNSGNITFFSKEQSNNWPYQPTSSEDEKSRTIFSIQPESGILLLFPSYIEHEVGINFTDSNRISISFNYS